jgi:hypothetical protein
MKKSMELVAAAGWELRRENRKELKYPSHQQLDGI